MGPFRYVATLCNNVELWWMCSQYCFLLCVCVCVAEPASEGSEEADGWGGGGDRPTGTQQEETAERPGGAAGGQRTTPESAQSTAQWDEVTSDHLIWSGFNSEHRDVCSNISLPLKEWRLTVCAVQIELCCSPHCPSIHDTMCHLIF